MAMHAEKLHELDSRLAAAPGVWIARKNLRFTFSRSSGPGGQAVNKLSTKALLRVPLTAIHGLHEGAADRLRTLAGRRVTDADELLIEAETFRSQQDNKQACIERFLSMLRQALVEPKVRRKKKPTRSMIEKRLSSKRRSSEKKSLRRTGRSHQGDFD